MHVVEESFKSFIEGYDTLNSFKIAYSGGVDSQVLLFLSKKYLKGDITALHVNHGISKNAKEWERKSKDYCDNNDINFLVKNVSLNSDDANLEEVARNVRYEFFKDNLGENEILMTGHHLNDQAETYLLRLMRGSGCDGLASMLPERSLGKGLLIRPLLGVSKEDIYHFAKENNLSWVEDESNKSSDYDRNFLRNEVIPLLESRWPSASRAISRSAKHCQIIKKRTEVESKRLLEKVSLSETILSIDKMNVLDTEDQKLVLRMWLSNLNQKMIDEQSIKSVINDVLKSKNDSVAKYKSKNYELRKSFNELHFVKNESYIKFKINLSGEFANIKICDQKDVVLKKMNFKSRSRSLNDILKIEKVPRWNRKRYPLFIKDGEIIAIGNIVSDLFYRKLIITKEIHHQ